MQTIMAELLHLCPALRSQVASKFLPSAIKFTYNWNMRELSNIFQGMCQVGKLYLFQRIHLCFKPNMKSFLLVHVGAIQRLKIFNILEFYG